MGGQFLVSPDRDDMHDLLELGTRAGALLKQRRETVAVGETSSGGLIAESLLAVPGASAFLTMRVRNAARSGERAQ